MFWSAVANSSFFILHSSFLQAQTITFTGDILLDRGVRHEIEQHGVDALFSPEIDSLFAASDVVVGNLECPATDIRTPASKLYVFRAEPEWLHALRRHGITHLNLANNHTVDQRRGGLRSTYDNCLRAGIVPIGAGETMNQAAEPVLLSGIGSQSPSPLGEEGRGLPQRNVWLFASQRLKLENFTYLPHAFSVRIDNGEVHLAGDAIMETCFGGGLAEKVEHQSNLGAAHGEYVVHECGLVAQVRESNG